MSSPAPLVADEGKGDLCASGSMDKLLMQAPGASSKLMDPPLFMDVLVLSVVSLQDYCSSLYLYYDGSELKICCSLCY